MLTVIAHKADDPMAPVEIADVWQTLSVDRILIAVAWTMIPAVSMLCLFARWLLQLGETPHDKAPRSRRRFVLGLTSLMLLAACTATVVVAAAPETAYWPHAQGALHLALTLSLPAMLTLIAVQGERAFRAFALGAAVPAVVEATYACSITYWRSRMFGHYDRPSLHPLFLLSNYVPSFATLWVASFVYGLVFLIVYWLFHRGRPKAARE